MHKLITSPTGVSKAFASDNQGAKSKGVMQAKNARNM